MTPTTIWWHTPNRPAPPPSDLPAGQREPFMHAIFCIGCCFYFTSPAALFFSQTARLFYLWASVHNSKTFPLSISFIFSTSFWALCFVFFHAGQPSFFLFPCPLSLLIVPPFGVLSSFVFQTFLPFCPHCYPCLPHPFSLRSSLCGGISPTRCLTCLALSPAAPRSVRSEILMTSRARSLGFPAWTTLTTSRNKKTSTRPVSVFHHGSIRPPSVCD